MLSNTEIKKLTDITGATKAQIESDLKNSPLMTEFYKKILDER